MDECTCSRKILQCGILEKSTQYVYSTQINTEDGRAGNAIIALSHCLCGSIALYKPGGSRYEG